MTENNDNETLALKGGNKFNPSSITKIGENRFELKYFGVGISIVIVGSKEEMNDYAWTIVSYANSDLPKQLLWLNAAIKGELFRCKSGLISSEDICKNWQGGVAHPLGEEDLIAFVQGDMNMIDDATVIFNFINK